MAFPALAFGWTFYGVLISFLIASSIIDFRTVRIPKSLTVSCFAIGVGFNIARGAFLGIQDRAVWKLSAGPVLGAFDGFLFSASGFAVALAIFFGIWFLKAAGGGDVKLFAAVGAWVGPWYIVLLMIASVVLVVIIHVGMLLTGVATSGFAKTQQAFSHKAAQKAMKNQRRGKRLTYSFPLALATAVVMLLVLWKDLGMSAAPADSMLPPVSQAR